MLPKVRALVISMGRRVAIGTLWFGTVSCTTTMRNPTVGRRDTVHNDSSVREVLVGRGERTDGPVYGSFGQDALLRLSMLQQRIFRYEQNEGRLPASVEEIVPNVDPELNLRLDPWRHPVMFRVSGVGYELRSAGDDGVLQTDDDIAVWGARGRQQPCLVQGPQQTIIDHRSEPPVCPKT